MFFYIPRRSMLLTIFVTIILSALISCAPPNQKTHQTYIYHGPGAFNTDWKTGDHLTVTWKAQPGPLLTTEVASQTVLMVRVIGPFQHIDNLLSAIKAHKNDPDTSHLGPTVISSRPVVTNSWTQSTFSSVITFPPNIKPGYYDLLLTSTVTPDTSLSTRSDGVIRVNLSIPAS